MGFNGLVCPELTDEGKISGGGAHYLTDDNCDERLAERKPVPPVLSIYGSLDSKISAEDAKLYERVPGATVVTIDGVGHSPQVEAPAKTVKLIEDFLASQPAEGVRSDK